MFSTHIRLTKFSPGVWFRVPGVGPGFYSFPSWQRAICTAVMSTKGRYWTTHTWSYAPVSFFFLSSSCEVGYPQPWLLKEANLLDIWAKWTNSDELFVKTDQIGWHSQEIAPNSHKLHLKDHHHHNERNRHNHVLLFRTSLLVPLHKFHVRKSLQVQTYVRSLHVFSLYFSSRNCTLVY